MRGEIGALISAPLPKIATQRREVQASLSAQADGPISVQGFNVYPNGTIGDSSTPMAQCAVHSTAGPHYSSM
jgi:hypothetical protein